MTQDKTSEPQKPGQPVSQKPGGDDKPHSPQAAPRKDAPRTAERGARGQGGGAGDPKRGDAKPSKTSS